MSLYYNWLEAHESVTQRLQRELYDVLSVEVAQQDAEGSVTFQGRLLRDPDTAFEIAHERFRRHGYTPLIRNAPGGRSQIVIALRGVTPARARPSRWLINLGLFLATVVTTTFAGSILSGANPLQGAAAWLQGVPFAAALLGILLFHELGHYFVARYHGVDVTLPYFIPVPLGLGTFGAFIQMRSPVHNRRMLFDVGIAGPLAGAALAIPLFIIGLYLSPVVHAAPPGMALGSSLMVDWLVEWVRPHPPGSAVILHPIGLAAWFGLLLTAFNLIPAGQLDGGHIAYALLGERARYLAIAVMITLVIMGLQLWRGWYFWVVFLLFTGLRHPPPLNDITNLDMRRWWVGLVGLVLLVLTFTPKPFEF